MCKCVRFTFLVLFFIENSLSNLAQSCTFLHVFRETCVFTKTCKIGQDLGDPNQNFWLRAGLDFVQLDDSSTEQIGENFVPLFGFELPQLAS